MKSQNYNKPYKKLIDNSKQKFIPEQDNKNLDFLSSDTNTKNSRITKENFNEILQKDLHNAADNRYNNYNNSSFFDSINSNEAKHKVKPKFMSLIGQSTQSDSSQKNLEQVNYNDKPTKQIQAKLRNEYVKMEPKNKDYSLVNNSIQFDDTNEMKSQKDKNSFFNFSPLRNTFSSMRPDQVKSPILKNSKDSKLTVSFLNSKEENKNNNSTNKITHLSTEFADAKYNNNNNINKKSIEASKYDNLKDSYLDLVTSENKNMRSQTNSNIMTESLSNREKLKLIEDDYNSKLGVNVGKSYRERYKEHVKQIEENYKINLEKEKLAKDSLIFPSNREYTVKNDTKLADLDSSDDRYCKNIPTPNEIYKTNTFLLRNPAKNMDRNTDKNIDKSKNFSAIIDKKDYSIDNKMQNNKYKSEQSNDDNSYSLNLGTVKVKAKSKSKSRSKERFNNLYNKLKSEINSENDKSNISYSKVNPIPKRYEEDEDYEKFLKPNEKFRDSSSHHVFNFLNDVYTKYAENLNKYLIKHQDSTKLFGSKNYNDKPINYYLEHKRNNSPTGSESKKHDSYYAEPIYGPNSFGESENIDKSRHDKKKSTKKLIKEEKFVNDDLLKVVKTYQTSVLEDMDLTPLPTKSRRKMKGSKEKKEFKNVERSAVAMRRYEYNRKILNRMIDVISELYRYPTHEMHQKTIKIQSFWRGLMLREKLRKFKIIYQLINNSIQFLQKLLDKKQKITFFSKIKQNINDYKKRKESNRIAIKFNTKMQLVLNKAKKKKFINNLKDKVKFLINRAKIRDCLNKIKMIQRWFRSKLKLQSKSLLLTNKVFKKSEFLRPINYLISRRKLIPSISILKLQRNIRLFIARKKLINTKVKKKVKVVVKHPSSSKFRVKAKLNQPALFKKLIKLSLAVKVIKPILKFLYGYVLYRKKFIINNKLTKSSIVSKNVYSKEILRRIKTIQRAFRIFKKVVLKQRILLNPSNKLKLFKLRLQMLVRKIVQAMKQLHITRKNQRIFKASKLDTMHDELNTEQNLPLLVKQNVLPFITTKYPLRVTTMTHFKTDPSSPLRTDMSSPRKNVKIKIVSYKYRKEKMHPVLMIPITMQKNILFDTKILKLRQIMQIKKIQKIWKDLKHKEASFRRFEKTILPPVIEKSLKLDVHKMQNVQRLYKVKKSAPSNSDLTTKKYNKNMSPPSFAKSIVQRIKIYQVITILQKLIRIKQRRHNKLFRKPVLHPKNSEKNIFYRDLHKAKFVNKLIKSFYKLIKSKRFIVNKVPRNQIIKKLKQSFNAKVTIIQRNVRLFFKRLPKQKEIIRYEIKEIPIEINELSRPLLDNYQIIKEIISSLARINSNKIQNFIKKYPNKIFFIMKLNKIPSLNITKLTKTNLFEKIFDKFTTTLRKLMFRKRSYNNIHKLPELSKLNISSFCCLKTILSKSAYIFEKPVILSQCFEKRISLKPNTKQIDKLRKQFKKLYTRSKLHNYVVRLQKPYCSDKFYGVSININPKVELLQRNIRDFLARIPKHIENENLEYEQNEPNRQEDIKYNHKPLVNSYVEFKKSIRLCTRN